VYVVGGGGVDVLKVAVAVTSALMVTVQLVEVPLHTPPDHPAKVYPEFGVAVRVTWVPDE
jgi:hypothetical protein